MKKLATLILLILICLSVAVGELAAAQVQAELRAICDELNAAIRYFGSVAPSQSGGR